MTPPVFAHGHLRLYLLHLLRDQPRHGYELIQALSDRFDGAYAPSAGTIYPRLAKLEEEGLVSKEVDGRKTVYRITHAGLQELAARSDELDDIEKGVDSSVQRLAQRLRAGLGAARDELRSEFSAFVSQARTADEEQQAGEGTARPAGHSREAGDFVGEFGQWASLYGQRAADAANAGWSAAETARARGADLAESLGEGLRTAFGAAFGEQTAQAGGEAAGNGTADERAKDGAQPAAGGVHADAAADGAQEVLDAFRDELLEQIRVAEQQGRGGEQLLQLLQAELGRVRELVAHTIGPRT